MAIGATAVWECRTTASNSGLQGGFYTSGGTDYSQLDTSPVILTDLSTNAAGTTVTSVGGGFTAAHVGNGIYLTGGNTAVTAGFYEIKTYISGTQITIDRSAGASKGLVAGATGRIGGATIFGSTPMAAIVAGNTVYIKAGTHTTTGNTNTTSGTTTNAINIIGYNSSRTDNPTGNNRPSISQGANYVYFGDYNQVYHLRFSGTSAIAVRSETMTVLFNCYSENTSGTANRYAFGGAASNNNPAWIDCEATSTNGYGIDIESVGSYISHCYIHDCGAIGINFGGTISYSVVQFTNIDTCVKAIVLSDAIGVKITNNVFYNNSTSGIESGSSGGILQFNNIFSSNGTHCNWTAAAYPGLNFSMYNWWYNSSVADTANFSKGIIGENTGTNPLFTNGASGDFSLQSASTAKNTAFAIRLGVG